MKTNLKRSSTYIFKKLFPMNREVKKLFRILFLVSLVILILIISILSDGFYDFEKFETHFVNPKFWFTQTSKYDRVNCSEIQRISGGIRDILTKVPKFNADDYHSLGNSGIVAIRISCIPVFRNALYEKFYDNSKDFVLVCIDGDNSPSNYGEDIIDIVNFRFVKVAYVQNNDVSHPKVKSIPIGVDYHTIFFGNLCSYSWDNWFMKKSPNTQELELYDIAKRLPPPERRATLAYTSATLKITDSPEKAYHKFSGTRQKLKDSIQSFKGVIVFESKKVKRRETWAKHGTYLFVVSPPGTGIDCHRTWEALILGNIVIVMRTPPMSEQLFERLPVVVIDDIKEITLENLKLWREDFLSKISSGFYDFTRLSNEYWVNRMKTELIS